MSTATSGQRRPDPSALHPLPEFPRVMFVRNLPDLPENVEIGEYTYYDDPDGPEAFRRNILYHYQFLGDRLVIGRFSAMAAGTRFIMNGGNHRLTGVSTYPFAIFAGWHGLWDGELAFPSRGDTVVGNDVWMGYDALLMPGVQVGDGAVIAARSVVTSDVPPYTIVGGNPAKVIRSRYDDTTVARLLQLAWWDWPVDAITEAIPLISQADVDALASFGRSVSGGAD